MKTQYYTASSLDGFIADAQGSLDWLFQFPHIEGDDLNFFDAVGAIAMGSSTYEWIQRHHIAHGNAWPYTQPTWVFSTRALPAVPGADIRFVSGDVRAVHQDMVQAADGKNRWIAGGGDLAGQFYDHGLLDELIVSVASVCLGAGAPLLPRSIVRPSLQLIRAKAYGTDFAQLHYAVRREATSAAA